jgi:hypothetical protein
MTAANTKWNLEGDYFEGCNCDSICPCIFKADPDEGFCNLTAAWHIQKGSCSDKILGHVFYPSPQWFTEIGPIEPYVLADLYAWLEAHSGLSHSFVSPTTGNMTSLSADMGTNPSSSENQ